MKCGITKIIPRVFAPTWKFKHLLQIPKNKNGLTKRKAKLQGKRIDFELLNQIQVDTCLETQVIREWLTLYHLSIVACQYYVIHENVFTYIDMIVENEEKQKFVVEIKRGCLYRRCHTQHGTLLYQSKLLTDAVLYHHQLQALIGRWLLQDPSFGVILVYVENNEIEVFFEEEFDAELSEEGNVKE